ncbi:MAG: type II toxin-antitoxin system HicB family antitoxin [Acidobacteria bacterium]|nr:type II toxin-antitoxin system HicB family antitoxin [Acidobacteriota bacterium]
MLYSVVLEEATTGGFTAWIVQLPGCFARARTREEISAKLPAAIRDFLEWRRRNGESVDIDEVGFEIVSSEMTPGVATEGDTSILLDADRAPLSEAEWGRIESWLDDSRRDLLDFLRRWSDESLNWVPEGSPRSLQQNLSHLAFVEFMYAAWTFDLHSVRGLEDFLAWTRRVASERMRELAARRDDRLTAADWAGASEPEEWTPRKAARRLLWHERLHLRSMQRRFRE